MRTIPTHTNDDEPILFTKPFNNLHNIGENIIIYMNYQAHNLRNMQGFVIGAINKHMENGDVDKAMAVMQAEDIEILEAEIVGYAFNKGKDGIAEHLKYVVFVKKVLFSNSLRYKSRINTFTYFNKGWIELSDYLQRMPYAMKAFGISKIKKPFVFR